MIETTQNVKVLTVFKGSNIFVKSAGSQCMVHGGEQSVCVCVYVCVCAKVFVILCVTTSFQILNNQNYVENEKLFFGC